jgi:hypothetical protein
VLAGVCLAQLDRSGAAVIYGAIFGSPFLALVILGVRWLRSDHLRPRIRSILLVTVACTAFWGTLSLLYALTISNGTALAFGWFASLPLGVLAAAVLTPAKCVIGPACTVCSPPSSGEIDP